MCGFGISTLDGLANVNEYCRRRGPDQTYFKTINGINFVFNSLYTVENPTVQPYISGDIVVCFDGTIYNHTGSQLEAIVDAYNEYGYKFASYLDGDFCAAIVDFSKRQIIMAKDTFGTKPMWYNFSGGDFVVASLRSQVTGLMPKAHGRRTFANESQVRSFDGELLHVHITNYFNFDQYITSTDRWHELFEEAVSKRTKTTRKIWTGLSSGYDSGMVTHELKRQEVPFKAWSMGTNENHDVLLRRYLDMGYNMSLQSLTQEQYDLQTELLKDMCDDPYEQVTTMCSARAESLFMAQAQQEGYAIYMGGTGADSWMSFGTSGDLESDEWHWPEDLYSHWPYRGEERNPLPWQGDCRRMSITKDEHLTGNFGMQARYPFLDKYLIQEYINLDIKIKNRFYKPVSQEYLERNNVPWGRHKTGMLFGSSLTNDVLLFNKQNLVVRLVEPGDYFIKDLIIMDDKPK